MITPRIEKKKMLLPALECEKTGFYTSFNKAYTTKGKMSLLDTFDKQKIYFKSLLEKSPRDATARSANFFDFEFFDFEFF